MPVLLPLLAFFLRPVVCLCLCLCLPLAPLDSECQPDHVWLSLMGPGATCSYMGCGVEGLAGDCYGKAPVAFKVDTGGAQSALCFHRLA